MGQGSPDSRHIPPPYLLKMGPFRLKLCFLLGLGLARPLIKSLGLEANSFATGAKKEGFAKHELAIVHFAQSER